MQFHTGPFSQGPQCILTSKLCGEMLCSSVKYDKIQHNEIHCKNVQCSDVNESVVHYSNVQTGKMLYKAMSWATGPGHCILSHGQGQEFRPRIYIHTCRESSLAALTGRGGEYSHWLLQLDREQVQQEVDWEISSSTCSSLILTFMAVLPTGVRGKYLELQFRL